MTLRQVSLDDKYDLTKKQIFVTGYQALVRLCLMQKERDRRAGLNTAGYITGYRGSPLGGLDQQFMRARKFLQPNDIVFHPGLNEDLAATALWGTQQAELRGEGKYDGVFGIWYGKGPGVDRTGDVFRHANFAGTSKHGGVLALMGDDHTAESSTTAHQSEYHFVDVMMPILNPAGVQEIIDYGLYGFAMSRYCGVWSALKCMHETVESTAVVEGSLDRVKIVLPEDFTMPPDGLNIRLRDTVLGQEARLYDYKRDAMLAFIRANKLNRMITSGGANPKIGVITTGKAYLDVRQALDELGIDEVRCNELGLRIFKIGCPWPIPRDELIEFARGLDLIIVVEEKRSLVEVQVREELYGTANQPVCIGKKDERGNWLFPVKGALDPNEVAITIGDRILARRNDDTIAMKVSRLKQAQHALAELQEVAQRTPYFCSGCPHNTSTVVPEGMRAYAGIGCHYMAQWMDRNTLGFTHMGGEGANWIGEAPFSTRDHVFQNLGDGTYNHSGYMAIRAAIAAGTNITYKILYNDAVAMTGGQTHEGTLTVPIIARQVAAEGVKRIAVVSDEPDKYPSGTEWPRGITFHHRDDLEAVQREFATIPGTSVLIYDQTCAAEKRRRRKRGTFPDPDKRVIINELVCEGCGDCGVKSNCVSVQPLMTEWGRKRTIDQSSCNKDYSCVKGFCPSFVTVHGGKPKKGTAVAEGEQQALPEPILPTITKPYGIIVTGIGGTGVVTIGGVLGMAAHLEGKGVGIIDMAGLAQKGGAVYSHIRIANAPDDIHAIRIAAGGADLVLGGDIVVAGNKKVLAAVKHGATTMIINTAEFLPGDFTRNADFSLPTERLKRAITSAAGSDNVAFIDATRLATALLGNSIAGNIFMVGYAWQKGAIPLSAASIEKAIEMNGEAVAMNQAAFRWGRRAALDSAAVEKQIPAPAAQDENRRLSQSLDEMIERRVSFLTDYQNVAYARRYRDLVAKARQVESEKAPGRTGFAEAVARNLFKLMAYKDEYEVARLFTDGTFQKQIDSTFEAGPKRFEFHLAPPLLARVDKTTGEARKMSFGPWLLRAFGALKHFKVLRGTPFDPFGYTSERRTERKLIADYETLLGEIFAKLNADNHPLAVGLAVIPEKIRGFGHVKARNLKTAKADEAALLEQFRAGGVPMLKAAE
ncbi:indolepyruvate ferredoxin oxidoreductase family protein [Pseudorhodoplanes sinuspersici]|uniref:Indolepyruvate ferredoxin oxidoreductase n=1 Tax=Pseudorhodoplanes sinuspersici TaxID=1235591 RepID=A0A1W6ZRA0_9HYPH|nr:indolepyruvate ferredoxin oxidoreductase family protein [Pseudorhodoplanes sinuspersici]ARP99891.1 indolepyruvate ferredoxin oxidoreductase [Pseudorhodoplanes sinuspersici]RKE70909.1 indolepyruvate ferredoxin oxidoreductase [Pseudorhodoplanes sinuspersici]